MSYSDFLYTMDSFKGESGVGKKVMEGGFVCAIFHDGLMEPPSSDVVYLSSAAALFLFTAIMVRTESPYTGTVYLKMSGAEGISWGRIIVFCPARSF